MAEKAIATNESYYSWEYFSNTKTATVYLNDSNGALRLEIYEVVQDTGINAYKRQGVIAKANIGTVDKPKLRNVASILKKHTLERSRASSPFKRQWTAANGQKGKLSEIIAGYRQDTPAGGGDDDRKRREIMKKLQNISGDELDALLSVVRMGSVSDRVATRFAKRMGVEE